PFPAAFHLHRRQTPPEDFPPVDSPSVFCIGSLPHKKLRNPGLPRFSRHSDPDCKSGSPLHPAVLPFLPGRQPVSGAEMSVLRIGNPPCTKTCPQPGSPPE